MQISGIFTLLISHLSSSVMNQSFAPEATLILTQLGGREFLLMTGARQLMAGPISEHNPFPWLRMNLPANQAGVNRLKITLLPSDTYRVEFYHQRLVDWEPVISQAQTFTLGV